MLLVEGKPKPIKKEKVEEAGSPLRIQVMTQRSARRANVKPGVHILWQKSTQLVKAY